MHRMAKNEVLRAKARGGPSNEILERSNSICALEKAVFRPRNHKSGIALFMVLATIFVILLLGEITLRFIGSQNRFSHEKINRAQAYYAATAGMNYALEMVRTGAWTFVPNTCTNAAPCVVPTIVSEFPVSILMPIRVIFCPSGSICTGPLGTASPFSCQSPAAGINFCINTTVTYHNQ